MAAGQGVGGTEPVLPHTDDPWVSLMQGKGLTAPTLPTFPGRELIDQARGRTVPVAKNSTPLEGLIFSKSRVHGYGQILGKAD